MYKLDKPFLGKNEPSSVTKLPDVSIPFDPDNTDYQAYLKWLAEGNEPLPAEEN